MGSISSLSGQVQMSKTIESVLLLVFLLFYFQLAPAPLPHVVFSGGIQWAHWVIMALSPWLYLTDFSSVSNLSKQQEDDYIGRLA